MLSPDAKYALHMLFPLPGTCFHTHQVAAYMLPGQGELLPAQAAMPKCSLQGTVTPGAVLSPDGWLPALTHRCATPLS